MREDRRDSYYIIEGSSGNPSGEYYITSSTQRDKIIVSQQEEVDSSALPYNNQLINIYKGN